MSRFDEINDRLLKLEEEKQGKKKKFKLPFKTRRLLKKEKKKPEYIVVQYLTRKYQVVWKLCRMISGNLVVINNKVHEINPKTIWRHGKQMWYVLREIDRKPVSNLDYNKVKRRRDDTEADVPLIKAVLGAVQKKSPLENKKGLIIGIIIAVVAAVVLYTFLK